MYFALDTAIPFLLLSSNHQPVQQQHPVVQPLQSTPTATSTAPSVAAPITTTPSSSLDFLPDTRLLEQQVRELEAAFAQKVELMESTYENLADSAVSKLHELRAQDAKAGVAGHERRRLWIGVAGCPGAGKSTVTEAVADRINHHASSKYDGVRATVIPMDGYHYSKAQLKERSLDIKRRGASWTFDAEAMVRDMTRAKEDDRSATLSFPTYSRELSDPVPNAVHLKPEDDIVIVEGLYLLLGLLEGQQQKAEEDVGVLQTALSCDDMWKERSVEDEIARWKPLLSLWDDSWFVVATSEASSTVANTDAAALETQMHLLEERLVKRTLRTWTPEKTAVWGGGTDEQAATTRTRYNDLKNAWFVSCCAPHAGIAVNNVSV